MDKKAHDLIRVLALERAGIRDGDGTWHGHDPVYGIVQKLAALYGLEYPGSRTVCTCATCSRERVALGVGEDDIPF